MRNIKDKLEKIDKEHYQLLLNIGTVAESKKQKAYLVGGMVRDLLLGYDNLDIDITVENDGIKLANALQEKFSYCRIESIHDQFNTAKIIFNINNKNIPVDLATTREEIYKYPAALPEVKISDLKNDLIRRDFTINALAVSILPDDFGAVIDLFDGLEDIKNKKIRILPNEKSFIDDPTRMIRAVRFAIKLGFEIEENTRNKLKETIESGQFDNMIERIRGDRTRIELRYLFNLTNIEAAICLFFESGIYRLISTKLNSFRAVINRIPMPNLSCQWLIYLALILKNLQNDEREAIMKNLQMTSEEVKIVQKGLSTYEDLTKSNKKPDSVSVFRKLKDLPIECALTARILSSQSSVLYTLLDEYVEKTSKVELEINGHDLITIGIPQGKQIGEILDKLLELKIKNPAMNKEEEINKARSLFTQK